MPKQVSKPRRIKCTDDHGNVSYIHQSGETWRCTLANGIPATFWYAVGNCNEMELRFALEDAETDKQRLECIVQRAGSSRTIELL